MSNSSLVNVTSLSPNHSGKRTHSIDRITPHCFVGQVTVERGLKVFKSTSRQASCNYVIAYDGKVGLCVDEANRSWCSSSNANDQRAVTIEVASDSTTPYAFKDAAYNKLIDLCADICKRNGKNVLLWIDNKDKALAYEPKSNEMVLTVHRWFANKSCPGDWMYARMGDLASKVTAKLGGNSSFTSTTAQTSDSSSTITTNKTFPNVPFTVTVLISDLNYRSQPSMGGTVKGTTGKGIFTISEVSNGWGKLKSGAGWIYLENDSYVTIGETVAESNSTASSTVTSTSYLVKVTANALNIRKGPGTNYAIVGRITNKGSYTIVKESNGFGKLKSGAGWIALSYTKKL